MYNHELTEDEVLVPTGKLAIFSLRSPHEGSHPTEEKLILGSYATLLIHYLKQNRYFATKISSSIIP